MIDLDNFDVEKAEQEEAKREEVKKNYENYGNDEVELAQMRQEFLRVNNESNAKNLDKLEERLDEISDNDHLLADEVKRVSEQISEEEKEEDEESETDETKEELLEEEDEKEEETKTVSDEEKEKILKEKEELALLMKEKDELIIKMYQQLQESQKVVETKEEVKEDPKPKANKEDIKKKVKEAIEKISYAEEDNASDLLTEVIMSLANEDKPAVPVLDESKIEELLNKREQKAYEQKFNSERDKFFASENGKKILADEDLFDLYQAKFVRLQNTGKHLNPEDLFNKALEQTNSVFGAKKASSSTASKAVPKVSDSLKEDVSKVEDTKKQAVKPTSSSNAGKTAESKKFNQLDAYKEYLKSIGQAI